MSDILVVDDEVGIRELLSEILADEGHHVRLAENAEAARRLRARTRPDLVLLDIWMPDTDGITLLKEWAARGQLTMPVVMMSGHGTIETAVEATRIGAYAFLEKPIALQKLLATVGKALTQAVPAARAPAHLSLAALGGAPVVAELKLRLQRAREARTPVLLLGEPGSGEELCARYLHHANTPWLEADALAGPGQGGIAEEGPGEATLFLRGVDDLSRDQQRAVLARLPALAAAGTRVVASARPAIAQQVADGSFDARLYAAMAVLSLRVPPLREHPEDIPAVAAHLLSEMVEAGTVPVCVFATSALNTLRLHPWPGNLVQLAAVVRSSALAAGGGEIRPADVAAVLGAVPGGGDPAQGGISLEGDLRQARDRFERAYFEYHVAREGGNMSRVADRVGLERTHLYRKLKQLGVPLPRRAERPDSPD